jgi:hypothetical protein
MASTNDVVTLVDAADTAVRTVCVLDLLKDSQKLPPFANDAVEGAIAMLDDALKGSALLIGQEYKEGFSGNLDALCWATDSYIAAKHGKSRHPKPADVEELLRTVRDQMQGVSDWIKKESNGRSAGSYDEAKLFFDTLARILAQRATDALTRPSRAQSAVQV